MYEHALATKRNFHIVNMDPAAEHFQYPISIDIRELISLGLYVFTVNIYPAEEHFHYPISIGYR
jgi:hypothetical protein